MRPVEGTITQGFGEHPEWYPGYNGHPGVDIVAERGTPVVATHEGNALVCHDPPGYGNYIYVIGDDRQTLYAHLDRFAFTTTTHVVAGDIVGYLGATGRCISLHGGDGHHLHYGKRALPLDMSNGYRGYVDPMEGE